MLSEMINNYIIFLIMPQYKRSNLRAKSCWKARACPKGTLGAASPRPGVLEGVISGDTEETGVPVDVPPGGISGL